MVCVAGISSGAGEGFEGGILAEADCGEGGLMGGGNDCSLVEEGLGRPFDAVPSSALETLMAGVIPPIIPLAGAGG